MFVYVMLLFSTRHFNLNYVLIFFIILKYVIIVFQLIRAKFLNCLSPTSMFIIRLSKLVSKVGKLVSKVHKFISDLSKLIYIYIFL